MPKGRGAARKAAVPDIWLPTGPARWSGLVSERPRLILFYHIEKTGGSAVMKWLHKMASLPDARLTSLMDFTHTSCFFALFPDLFPGYKDAWDPRRCTGPKAPDWRRAAIATSWRGRPVWRRNDRSRPRTCCACGSPS